MKTAVEHKDGFGKGSDGTGNIITGIGQVLRRPERPKKSWEHNEELKKEFNKVQVPSGGRGPNGAMLNG